MRGGGVGQEHFDLLICLLDTSRTRQGMYSQGINYDSFLLANHEYLSYKPIVRLETCKGI